MFGGLVEEQLPDDADAVPRRVEDLAPEQVQCFPLTDHADRLPELAARPVCPARDRTGTSERWIRDQRHRSRNIAGTPCRGGESVIGDRATRHRPAGMDGPAR
ncbi:hypothetical protein GCM10020366_62080 [Saccharopolyspora gregorii]|uniref:Uncharacterized protein n=1 Tax=Saccharopolyspora gregorii TaxID=33914 RepID=A0ABP6S0N1_9PSEU